MRRKSGRPKVEAIAPPVEQMREGAFALLDIVDSRKGGGSITIGRAYRRRPMIDILHDQGLLNREELKALKHYRHHADMVDGSLTRDSLSIQPGGQGDGITVTMLNACYLVRTVESAVGQLVDILRAVVVDDTSLSQWAINRFGGIEKRRVRKGRAETRIEPSERGMAIAKMEMKFAAQRVVSELAA